MPARRLVARQGGRIEPTTYWITVGDAVAPSGTAQKLAQLRYGVRGVVPDGLLMRVSSIDADPVRAHALQAEFTRALRAALAPGDRPLVFGAVGGAP